MSVTVLYGSTPLVSDSARQHGARLWLSPGDLEAATGWYPRPEGLCRGDACVPLPDAVDADGWVDVVALAERLNQPVVHDARRSAWVFGTGAVRRDRQPGSTLAPEFTLPDLEGTKHSLSDYRGRKVFLHSYGSY